MKRAAWECLLTVVTRTPYYQRIALHVINRDAPILQQQAGRLITAVYRVAVCTSTSADSSLQASKLKARQVDVLTTLGAWTRQNYSMLRNPANSSTPRHLEVTL